MNKARLAKLAALTQGVALVSSLTVACDRTSSGESTQPPMQPAINAPPSPPPSTTAATSPDDPNPKPEGTPSAVPIRRLPIPNAPPGKRFPIDSDAATSK
jgi:hypothetical protein